LKSVGKFSILRFLIIRVFNESLGIMRNTFLLFAAVIVSLVCLKPVYADAPPWKFASEDGNHSLTLGFLAQTQYESIENTTGTGNNLDNVFFRRFRFIAGGKLAKKFSYFIESDAPNLGKAGFDGKRTADMFVQDAYVSYAFRPEFQLDGGMIIVPVSHNSVQSAASLLPVDFGPYSFLCSDPTLSKNGRDYGLQARGLIRKHFEYRVGMFRGNRNHDGAFPYRYTARVVYYPFEPDTGFFYTGTTLGQKKILGIGASFDRQDNYSANAVDLFVDVPVRKGNAWTLQADFIRYDGSSTFPTLPQQNAWLLESSVYIKKARLGPFIQFASRDFTKPGVADDQKMQGGVAFWILKHRINIKAGFARLFKTASPTRTQFVLQSQFFYF
jgi:hypothetical protein